MDGVVRQKTPEQKSLEAFLSPEFFKALSDPSRLAILSWLAACDDPCCVSQIAEYFPIDPSVVSRHLTTLRKAQVVQSERRGKEVYYSVQVENVIQTLRNLADALESCCASECNCLKTDKFNQ